MLPVLFKIGPFTFYSFGAMVAIAFLVADRMARADWERRGLRLDVLGWAPAAALAAGLLGAKLYFTIQHPPGSLAEALSFQTMSSGLTWYGGLIGGALAVAYLIRRSREPFALVADGAAPALAASYGVGRIGCLLAGDGDYGPPSDLPWAMAFPNGTVPTNERVHPTPAYETLAMAGVVAVLFMLRDRVRPGRIFALYVILTGLERFLVEFVRLNPPVAGGLSEPQLWSFVMIAVGAFLWARPPRVPERAPRRAAHGAAAREHAAARPKR